MVEQKAVRKGHHDRLSQMKWEQAKNGCQSLGVVDNEYGRS
jgi:hypothetical protein